MTFLYRELSSADDPNSWHADRLMRWCASDLYIPPQPIRWHSKPVKAQPGEPWRDVVGPGRFSAKQEHWAGWIDTDPGIAVVVGQSQAEMLKTVAHEVYHVYEEKEGRAFDESRAEAYARRVSADYLVRRIP